MDLRQERSRHGEVEVLADDRVQRPGVEGTDRDRMDPLRRQAASDLESDSAFRRRATSEQESDVLVPKSSRRVADRPGRRSVEPLSVVDRDEQLLLGAHGPQDVQHRNPHGMRIRRGAVLVVEDECAGEGAALCRDELIEHVCEDGIEKIAERRERQLGLALRRKRAQDPQTSFLRVGHAGRPERRLAHARVALEEERGCAVGDPGEEVPEGGELRVAPYDRSRHCALIVRRARRCAYGVSESKRMRRGAA